MTLPPMSPTGALASGDYVEYMLYYNNLAEDDLASELDGYVTQSTIDDWHRLWDRVLADTSISVTTLEAAVSKLKSQTVMVKDAISKM
jgi:hypothetical protein